MHTFSCLPVGAIIRGRHERGQNERGASAVEMTAQSWKTEGVEYLLDVRTVVYGIFHRLLGEEPSEESLGILDLPETGEALLFALDGREGAREALDRLRDHAPLEELANDYTRLFIGPNALPAAPWESVYVNDERMIFQESTLDVRQTYLNEGLLPAEYPHVADDHIAIELDFMMKLNQRLSADGIDSRAALRNLKSQRSFLDKHLGKWVTAYAECMAKEGRSPFYADVTHLTSEFVACDSDILKELMGAVE